MRLDHVNYVAVLAAALAASVFGAIWYRVFITRWMDALGKTKEQLLPRGRQSLVAMAIAFVAELLMAAVLANLVPIMGPVSVLSGLMTSGACWLGFILTTIIVNNGYSGGPRGFTAVASWHWLGVLLIMGGVIGVFG